MKEYVVADTGDVMMIGGKIKHELVRCKDCKFSKPHYTKSVFGNTLYECTHERYSAIAESRVVYSGDWYCADGERK